MLAGRRVVNCPREAKTWGVKRREVPDGRLAIFDGQRRLASFDADGTTPIDASRAA